MVAGGGEFDGGGVAAGGNEVVASTGSSGGEPEGSMPMICWNSGSGGSPMRVTAGTGATDEDEDEDGDVEVGLPVVVASGVPLGWLDLPSLPGGSEGGVAPGGRGTPPKGTALTVSFARSHCFTQSYPKSLPQPR